MCDTQLVHYTVPSLTVIETLYGKRNYTYFTNKETDSKI